MAFARKYFVEYACVSFIFSSFSLHLEMIQFPHSPTARMATRWCSVISVTSVFIRLVCFLLHLKAQIAKELSSAVVFIFGFFQRQQAWIIIFLSLYTFWQMSNAHFALPIILLARLNDHSKLFLEFSISQSEILAFPLFLHWLSFSYNTRFCTWSRMIYLFELPLDLYLKLPLYIYQQHTAKK